MDVREKSSNGKRLIDADALMDVIRQHEYRLATAQGSIDYGMFTLGIQQAVDEQPTIDAVPVRHGRWIEIGYACGETEYQCSECKETEWRTSASRLKYCPFCGAKMDLKG